jgi:predicted amidohydrolase
MSTTALVAPDGRYETVELAKDEISLCIAQTRVRAVDVANLAQSRRENLQHLLDSIDKANNWLGPKDLVLFHEFPIVGFNPRWRRDDLLKVAIEVPGEETEAVAAKAKMYKCHVVFGTYAVDPAWPNHILSLTCIIGPDGSLLGRHWKARNVKGLFGPFEVFTSTIFDCYDQYVERYGVEETVPVTRTAIGNICTTSTQHEPELIRAFALRGGEIMLRTATAGFFEWDIQANAFYNKMYTAIVNNAISPNNPGVFDDAAAGNSAIYGPDGALLAKATSGHETAVLARIPIKAFREKRRLPAIHPTLYRDLYAQYQEAWPPNAYSAYQPADGFDAARYLASKRRWL